MKQTPLGPPEILPSSGGGDKIRGERMLASVCLVNFLFVDGLVYANAVNLGSKNRRTRRIP
jgi:hypothetical protein